MTTRRYAEGTTVSVEKSEAELKGLLRKYGATATAFMEGNGKVQVVFEMKDRRIVMAMPIPMQDEKRFTVRTSGRPAPTPAQVYARWEQACRERWRALVLIVKAKLEAVETNIVTFDDEFLAYTMKPDGETIGQWAKRELPAVLGGGRPMPPLLGPPS